MRILMYACAYLCMRTHPRAQKCKFWVLDFLFVFFLLLFYFLIICLGFVEYSFRMFSIGVSRITRFICFDC